MMVTPSNMMVKMPVSPYKYRGLYSFLFQYFILEQKRIHLGGRYAPPRPPPQSGGAEGEPFRFASRTPLLQPHHFQAYKNGELQKQLPSLYGWSDPR